MPSADVLLFDLDGTLTDPRVGIVRCIRHALERLARPCPPDDVLASFIGPPLRGTFAALLETSDRDVIEGAMTLYRERFGDVGLFENDVYDGIPDMLAALAGSRSFVATSKPRVYARRILDHFDLGRHFAGVYGAELAGRFDEKADLLAHLLATEQVVAESAVMIGDRAVDVVAAKANGIRSIGVLWGYGSERELVGAGAHAVCATPVELTACLSRMIPVRRRPAR
jgi:phosphoglycolate phosphatase